MQIQRLGHSMFRIVTDEGYVIVVDPWIKGNPSCVKEWQEMDRWVDTDLVLCTHAHFDHLLACRELQERTGAPFYLHPADQPLVATLRRTCMTWLGYDPGPPPDITGDIAPSETIQAGDIALEVRHTPGHSPGSVTLVDHVGRRAFTGDALFAGSIGRTDLPGGDMRTLLASIRSQILTLPDDFAVFPGHGEASTVGDERRGNPFLARG